jgi:cytochrome P450
MPYFRSLGTRSQKSGHYFFYTLALEALAQHAAKPPNALPITPYVTTLFTASAAMDPPLPVPELSSLVSSLFGAGADTSSSTLITFLLACCAFPAAAATAQRELDAVVGPSRSPTWDDRPRLPYVDAFVKEVFRWRSVAIIGGQPHAPTQDDAYKGWRIPRGTWVQGNVWAIHRNEREFPDPDRFAPERFLEGSELWRPFPGERGYMTFGWGRRVCSGQALAEQGTWITVARVLWGFRVEKGVDPKTGREREVDIFAFTNGLNMRPQPFECEIAPRSEEVRATMEREGREALEELKVYDGESEYRMSTFYKAMKGKVGEEPVVDEEGNIKIVKVKG